MERNWSEAARNAFEAYPWSDSREKARAHAETELVSFGERVEVEDLPLAVRRWLQAQPAQRVWKGESWKTLIEEFEKSVLSQALAAHGGFVAKAARALDTTPRIVAYKARKYGLLIKQKQSNKETNE